MLDIKLLSEKKLEGYTLIEGFPGVGLVGPMAVSYIIEKLSMEYFGYFESQAFPPLVSIHNGIPMHPVRLYASSKYKLVAIFAEFAIPPEMTYILSKKIMEFISANKIAKIISIGGMPSANPAIELGDSQDSDSKDVKKGETVYAIISRPDISDELKDSGVVPITEGVATGISAILMIDAVAQKIPDINILVQVDQNVVDPRYAEIAIKSVDKIADLKIDITELDKEAKQVESKIHDILKKNKESHDSYKKAAEETGPSMYA